MRNFSHGFEDSALISANQAKLFAFIDNHSRLSSHMNKPSLLMGGGSMKTSTDSGKGMKIGSHIRMKGKVFWITISLDEVITQRSPPKLKVWETVGTPHLLVIGNYRMRAEIKPKQGKSLLSVSIEYDLPEKSLLLGRLFGKFYAKWCVKQMIKDSRKHFEPK